MRRYSIHPGQLLDRPWRCGHPFRAHRGRFRRWCMSILFVLLCLVIGGYTYLTDSDRVRIMAQDYLSALIGGRVQIGKATLSIFEGLRLERVSISVDPEANRPDSLLFNAQSLIVNYDPRKLIAGQLDATEIVTQKPMVFLTFTQSVHGDHWNYDRLHGSQARTQPSPAPPPARLLFPTFLLRNAVVEIGELKVGRRVKVGSMAVDGQFTQSPDGQRYRFELQSRGVNLGPYASGSIDANTGEVNAHLRNVSFGEDLRSMFPADLRDWWERHELSGRIESVDVAYEPARGKVREKFSIRTELKAVTLAVRREEWSGQEDVDRLQRVENAISLLRGPYEAAGFRPLRSEENLPMFRTTLAPGKLPSAITPVESMLAMVDATPVLLRDVGGVFVFTQDGIDVSELLVRVGTGDPRRPLATNTFQVDGHLGGYTPDSPLRLKVTSAESGGLYFPAHPTYLASLPHDIRDFYENLQPEGNCRINAEISRPIPGAVPQVSAELEVLDATFVFREFPYPFRSAGGKIAFGRDPFSGKNYVSVMNMHALGIKGGLNENSPVTINGRVGPLSPESPEPGFDLRATGSNISSEPALMAAIPKEVREALKIFDAPGKGEFPQFRCNFVCNVQRAPGPGKRFSFDTNLNLLDATGRITVFPYPCRHVYGKITVHTNRVEINDVTITNGAASAKVTGRVRWADDTDHGQPLDMNVKIAAKDLPIDQELINSIPAEARQWLIKLGVDGKLNCMGTVYTVLPDNWRASIIPGVKPKDPPVQYDLALSVRDGTIWPQDGLFSISSVSGLLHLTSHELEILAMHGRRDAANVSATGLFTFDGPSPKMSLHVGAENLAMDRPLYSMLPADARKAWDEVQPEGTIDAKIDYDGPLGGAAPPPATQPIASASSQIEIPRPPDTFHAVLHPRQLQVRIRTAPYPLTFTAGTVDVTPGKAILKGMEGGHGNGKLLVSGVGALGPTSVWDLNLHAQKLLLDPEFRRAMPPTLLGIVDGLKLDGLVGFDFPRFSYRTSTASPDPEIDLSGDVSLANGTMDVGVPLTNVNGGMKFTAATRQGKIDSLTGSLLLDSLTVSGRPITDLKFDLIQSSGRNDIHIDNITGKIANGELAGSVLLTVPDTGASRYTMNLIVRNADVRELTDESDPNIRGEVTASLAMEGAWGDARARRGRGDVVIVGKDLYRVPLVLGVLQVTNLSLPIGGPFTHGTARYDIEGMRINFEQMDLRSDTMQVNGSGYLDFGSRQVRMTLTTDSPGGFKVPFLHDILQGARQELLQINVRGTIQEPKVEPTSMGTFTTTIDQVFRGKAGE
jgi:hypothetical protein